MTAADTATLRTGWEPDTPPGDTIARQVLLALVARAEHTAQALGARWTADAHMAAADLGLPGLFGNNAFLADPGSTDAALDRIDGFFRPGTQYLCGARSPPATG